MRQRLEGGRGDEAREACEGASAISPKVDLVAASQGWQANKISSQSGEGRYLIYLLAAAQAAAMATASWPLEPTAVRLCSSMQSAMARWSLTTFSR